MPQFDPSSFSTQIFWLAVCFVALYLIMWKVVLPRFAEVLEARQDRIDDDLERARKSTQEAEEVLAAYEKALAGARSQAHELVAEAVARVATEAAARNKALSEKIAQAAAEAERRIDAARREAMGKVRDVAVEVSRATIAQLAGGAKVGERDIERAVDAAIKG